jgi:hypothetical protein
MAIEEALAQARVELLGKPGIHGISSRNNQILVYAESSEGIPTTILGYPVTVIITKRFEVF